MRNLKLSFAVVIAILAVGVTVVTKASEIGKRAITKCYVTMQITDGLGQFANLSDALTAAQAQTAKSNNPYVSSVGLDVDPAVACKSTIKFCCAKVIETANPLAPEINLGEGLRRYEVDELFFKP